MKAQPKTIGDLWRQRDAMERAVELRAQLSDPPGWLAAVFSGYQTHSGQYVQGENALRATAVYACVSLLAKSVAGLPLLLLEEDGKGAKVPAKSHPLYSLLLEQPNDLMTAYEMREADMVAILLRGNAYARITRNGAGDVVELNPIHPDFVIPRVTQDRTSLVYELRVPGDPTEYLSPGQIWHRKGMTLNGLIGVSPIAYNREAVGLAMAQEEHGARLFGNGAALGGVLSVIGELGDEERERARESFEHQFGGVHNAGKTLVLEGDWKYQPLSMTSQDAQYIDSRKFQLAEIARIFDVPLHMLKDLERATFSNIEAQGIDFVVYTLRPWIIRWEQSIKRDLLLPEEQKVFHPVFNVDALLRGDAQARWNAHKLALEAGVKSRQEVRLEENMNPGPEELEEFLVPMNFQTVAQQKAAKPAVPGAPAGGPPEPQDGPDEEPAPAGSQESEGDDAS